MEKSLKTVLLLVSALWILTLGARTPSELIIHEDGSSELLVDGRPFIMLAGEVHNSSNSTPGYMNTLWPTLRSLHLNTVLASIAWEQFEPQEGLYDYTLVDNLVTQARANGLKVVVLWFGSWKNGESSYAPAWVKRDTERFARVETADGRRIETLSPFCEETMLADARAYGALVKRIREIDAAHGTVIALQPENEVGIFQDRDYTARSLADYERPVPRALLAYLTEHRASLRPELRTVWEEHGAKRSGSWREVFGDNVWGYSFHLAWQYASYIDRVAAAGKSVYVLPTFCNCWIVQQAEDLPGVYPNGGPVSRVMDIWKAAAPHVDVLAPDIYLPNFKEIVADYHRADNPLLIPESVMNPAHAFWAFGEHDALCYSPFGIEDGAGNHLFAESYRVLGELLPLIASHRNTSDMIGVMKSPGERERIVEMGDYRLKITYDADDAYGLIIRTSADEFVVAGINFKVSFTAVDPAKTGYILQVLEGGFPSGTWETWRVLNGDETFHHSLLIARGRRHLSNERVNDYSAHHSDEVFVYSPESYKAVWSPGIYRVTTYLR